MKKIIFTYLFATVFASSLASSSYGAEQDKPADPTHHAHHAALFGGSSVDPSHFALGVDYEYRLPSGSDLLGAGVVAEKTFASHSKALLAAAVYVHPYLNSKILLASGKEFAEEHSEFLFRAGVGYDFHVNSFTVTPSIDLDFVGGERYALVGASIGMGF